MTSSVPEDDALGGDGPLDAAERLSALAEHYGIHRRYLVRLAHTYNIPLRDPHAPRAGITKAWLTEHYHDRNRSANDIANELGLHPNTVLHWCRYYNIPIKPRGSAGHRTARQHMPR